MSENTTMQRESLNDNPLISVERLPGIGIDLEQEKALLEQWQETGECVGPRPIGEITIDDTMLNILVDGIPGVFMPYENMGTAEGSDLPRFEPDRESDDQRTPEAKEAMNQIFGAFLSIIKEDLATLDPKIYKPLFRSSVMYAGKYEDPDELHIDGAAGVRYILTFTGPGTMFYNGSIPPSLFDEDGELNVRVRGTNATKNAVNLQLATGTVARFNGKGDPHSSPVVQNPVFRIMCNSTVSV